MTTGLEYFLVLAQEGSISRAAQRLFVTQQSMSEQMKRLEEHYGTPLFVRRPRFALTPAGQALLATLRQIRVLEQGLDAQMDQICRQGGGPLRVGIHAARARVLLPGAVSRFRADCPQVELIFFHDDTQRFEQMLLNGELDLFFGVDPRPLAEFQYIPLAREPIRLAARRSLLCRRLGWENPEEHPCLSAGDLEKLDFIFTHDRSNFQRKLDEFFRTQGIAPRRALTVADAGLQLTLAAGGQEACFCPGLFLGQGRALSALHPEDPLLFFPVEGLDCRSQLSLVLHQKSYRSPALHTFVEALKQELEANRLWEE